MRTQTLEQKLREADIQLEDVPKLRQNLQSAESSEHHDASISVNNKLTLSSRYKEVADAQKLLDAERALTRELEDRAQGSDRQLSDISNLRETIASLESGSYFNLQLNAY